MTSLAAGAAQCCCTVRAGCACPYIGTKAASKAPAFSTPDTARCPWGSAFVGATSEEYMR